MKLQDEASSLGEMEVLKAFIRSETGYDGEIEVDADLLDAHILDSFNIVTLAMFIQEKFDIELDADDLVRDNLSKITSIVDLIRRKRV